MARRAGWDFQPVSPTVECLACHGDVALSNEKVMRKHLDHTKDKTLPRGQRICVGSRTENWRAFE